MHDFIKRVFKDRYRGTAVKQVTGEVIPPPFEPDDPGYVKTAEKKYGLFEDPGHPLGWSSMPVERFTIEVVGGCMVITAVDMGARLMYPEGTVVEAERLEIRDHVEKI